MPDITIKNTNVNSGTAVSLNASKINFSWKNNFQNKPIVSAFDNVEPDYLSIENPTIIINGTIDAESNAANTVTQALLIDFALEKTADTTLGVVMGKHLRTHLAEDLTDDETGVDVDEGSVFTAGDYIQINNEIMKISSISTDTLTVTRAKAQTTATTHSTDDAVYLVTVLEGRPSAGYSVGGTALDTIKVVVKSFTIDSNAQNVEHGARIAYNLTLVESK